MNKKVQKMSSTNPWLMLGATVVGIVSAAGMIIAEHYRQERMRHKMSNDMAQLNEQMMGMKLELEQLQKKHAVKHKRIRRVKTDSTFATSTTDGFNSAVEMDSSDLEYYDISDEEETSKASTVTPLAEILKEIDTNLDSGETQKILQSLENLKDLCIENPENPELLWRIGKAHHKLCLEYENDVTTKLGHIEKGVQACMRATELNSDCGDAHKWFAILLGSRSDHQGLKDKLRDSADFKKHLDIALGLKPEDATLYHLLGRYAIEIASLKWYEKKAVATIFGELPACTYDEAVSQLLEAERLGKKDWKENKLSLGKCYIALGNYKEAIKWLEDAQNITEQNSHAKDKIDVEIDSLLAKYNSYR